MTHEKVEAARQLNEIARRRGQTLAEMALAWVLKDERMTSVIVGASSVNQLADNLKALEHLEFTADELKEIEQIYPDKFSLIHKEVSYLQFEFSSLR